MELCVEIVRELESTAVALALKTVVLRAVV